jgi:hypothetical protein
VPNFKDAALLSFPYGPYSGGKHQFMIKDEIQLTIPNPHQSDIGINLLMKILKQAGISRQQWEKL